ncbi:MAG: hypothetical protein WCO28_04430 [Bacteroidota bacterium]
MKTKLTAILIFAIVFSMYTILSSCQKDKPCVHNTTELGISSSDFAKVPYTDTSKLTFVRVSTNDTFTFTGHGWVIDYGTLQTGYEDGCYQNYNLQRKRIAFTSLIYPLPITLAFQYYSAGIDYLEIDFNKTSYIVGPGGIRKPYEYDSLLIQNKHYYNIRYFKNEYKPEYNTPYGCYYNITQGILRMETSDKDKWELIKVE